MDTGDQIEQAREQACGIRNLQKQLITILSNASNTVGQPTAPLQYHSTLLFTLLSARDTVQYSTCT